MGQNHLFEPVATASPSVKRDFLRLANQVIARYREAVTPLLPKLGPSLLKKLKVSARIDRPLSCSGSCCVVRVLCKCARCMAVCGN